MARQSDSAGRNVQRSAGILLHPTSLPGVYGIGDLGDELTAFLDWASSARMHLWQVLPLNPPGYGNSPYNCLSSVGGNPYLISPQRLLQDGLLTASSVSKVPEFSPSHVEFERVVAWKMDLLREAFTRFESPAGNHLHGAFETFDQAPAEREWLDDFALFMALKRQAGGGPWWMWPKPLAHRDEKALKAARQELAHEIRFRKFLQFIFFRQWAAVREAAHARGIRIMGDIPIYVAADSVDVWANRHLFELDERGEPTFVAGVPPDYFSATGQRWGNPLYRWNKIHDEGYRWWITRIRMNLQVADMIRLDHFRGFAAYWEIPAHEPTAVHGRWMPGPGKALFDAIRDALGDLPLVAEDLGFITPEVHELRHAIGVPGMKILQFGFSQPDSPHLPHRFDPHTVVYTGTHDNDTARGWFAHTSQHDRELARIYLGDHGEDVEWSLIRAAYTSVAETAIVPVQDVLGLGPEARMNRPGAEHDNWNWRLEAGALTRQHADRLRHLAEITGRV